MNRKILFIIFSTIAIIGFIDVASRILLKMGDFGVVAYGAAFVFTLLLGANLGATIAVALGLISSLWIIFAILAFFFRNKSPKGKTVPQDN